MSQRASKGSTIPTNGCTHPFQCPNPQCQRVFELRRGLSMHFYHQDNVFCNPPEGFRTNVEIEFPSYLPPELPPLLSDSNNGPDKSVVSDSNATMPCWSVGVDESTNEVTGHADLPSEVNIQCKK